MIDDCGSSKLINQPTENHFLTYCAQNTSSASAALAYKAIISETAEKGLDNIVYLKKIFFKSSFLKKIFFKSSSLKKIFFKSSSLKKIFSKSSFLKKIFFESSFLGRKRHSLEGIKQSKKS